MTETFWQDVRSAARGLRRTPGFTIGAIVVIALGIGANAAVFSVFDAAVLRGLPVTNPRELVALDVGRRAFSYPLFEELSARQTVFTEMAASGSADVDTVRLDGTSENLSAAAVAWASANYFSMLGIPAATGRVFTPEDGRAPGDALVAVIGYHFWQRQFDRDPAAVGRTIFLNGTPFTIVGVARDGFFGERIGLVRDVWVPILAQPRVQERNLLEARTASWFRAFGRLRPGVTLSEADAQLTAILQQFRANEIAAGLGSRNPRDVPDAARVATQVSLNAGRSARSPLGVLMAVAGVVLLIACCNLANLLLMRGAARQREIAIRLAVGASRRRLIRPLLAESLLLACAGGALGLLLARWTSDALAAAAAMSLGEFDVRTDGRVLAFTAAISLATALLFGLVPALRATAAPRLLHLHAGGVQAGRRQPLGRVLVVSQVALSLCLLAGAGLLLRSLGNLARLDVGVDRTRVATADLAVEGAPVAAAEVPQLRRILWERLRTIPGVESVAFSMYGHFRGGAWTSPVRIPESAVDPEEDGEIRRNGITADYFQTLGLAVTRGRAFDERDSGAAPKVAIINETMARHYFGQTDPIGKWIYFPVVDSQRRYVPFAESLAEPVAIAGVVQDAKYDSLREDPVRMVYTPLAQMNDEELGLIHLRVSPATDIAAPQVRQAVRNADPRLLLRGITMVEDEIAGTLGQERLFATLLALFGGLALLLAAVGLYGVIGYGIRRRTREIGVRLALGATRARVQGMVLRETVALTAIGIAIGVPGALLGSRIIANLLYGLTPSDPSTLGAVAVVMLAAAALAGLMPGRRAASVDPNVALRYE